MEIILENLICAFEDRNLKASILTRRTIKKKTHAFASGIICSKPHSSICKSPKLVTLVSEKEYVQWLENNIVDF